MTPTTETLIDKIGTMPPAHSILLPPHAFALRLITVLAVYGLAVSVVLGVRSDIMVQFTRLPFMLEILLLLAIAVSSVYAAALVRYPDVYQRERFLVLPYGLFLILLALLSIQTLFHPDPRMVFMAHDNGMDCSVCVAAVACLPAALLFIMVRNGATIHPVRAGSFAVLGATAIGCLTLRLEEANDAIAHLVTWHYIPTLLFALLGAFIGKYVLKW